MQLVSRLPPLRYRFGLSDPPEAVAPRSVRCLNYNLHQTFQTGENIQGLSLARAEYLNTNEYSVFTSQLLTIVLYKTIITEN